MLAYEELKGSTGRQIFFRPKRYDATELFAGIPPKVRLKASTFRLHNISMTGVAAVVNQTVEDKFEPGEVVPLQVMQAGLIVFEGKAKIVRSEKTVFGSTVALSLLDGVVDFHSLLRRNAQARISQQLALLEPQTSSLVSADYRAHCADVLRFLRSYRAVIEASTSSLAGGRGLDPNDAYAMCEERMVPQFRTLWRTGNQLVRPAMSDKKVLEATKEYSELVLTPELCAGPMWHRSYFKPAGYPGDFEIMNYVYDWQREGADVYSQLLHRLGLEVAECIGTRMHVVRKVIGDVVRAKANGKPARIMSLGCGSAREIQLYLEDQSTPDAAVNVTLVDQEQAALAYAYEKSYPRTISDKPSAKLRALNVSFTEVLRGGQWLDEIGPQDMIYSVGLIDYLIDRRAKALAARLYERLAPGGLLVIGNMNEIELSNLWPMEFLTDWHLFYRTDAEMLAWTEGMQNKERAWTECEPTDRVRLLYVRKSA